MLAVRRNTTMLFRADTALETTPSIKTVVVIRRTGKKVNMKKHWNFIIKLWNKQNILDIYLILPLPIL